EHLREMDDLKQSVQNASYEQKDPLLIYKFESFKLFREMLEKVNRDVVSFLFKASLPNEDGSVREAQAPRRTDTSNLKTSRSDGSEPQRREPVKAQPVRMEKKVGRNEPCPCGSGKKYKQCHGTAE
ncbi:MAG: SEC-C domain-containing protein, partial [Bacteroidetes bacterium]|nr:SEC-C domain-containing protein [Bacteroidota bacterium]